MGAPNIVHGRSHSGNVAAAELAAGLDDRGEIATGLRAELLRARTVYRWSKW
ncbi:N-acetylmuramoyl-L-alanine amidase [Pseudomonas sp. IT-P74]|nr:hypothetical protein BSF44_28170 [Pseudomonas sp. ACN8]